MMLRAKITRPAIVRVLVANPNPWPRGERREGAPSMWNRGPETPTLIQAKTVLWRQLERRLIFVGQYELD